MRAMVINRFGGADEMRLEEVQTPEPREGEILIKLAFSAVNPIDWKIRAGHIQHLLAYQLPCVVGFDGTGIVARVGPGVTEFKEGDAVMTCSERSGDSWGSYAEFVRVGTSFVAPM